ncbi:MAG TPA: PQQ-binding-like beta-propeller repeat protein [Bryobacteraceae bacterium]|jgi:outer membrane protein assembly factor BamB|nr:PQQ-binding-like beta-propeller repeat protein [Bryobacteraceae bacterium]
MRALGLLLAVSIVFAADWPQFRGPNGSGVAAPDAEPPVKFGAAKWKTALPVGHSSPSVWGDRIFLTSFDPDSKKLEVLCASAKTGAIQWRHVAPAPQIEETHVVSNPATASPAVDEKRVYAYFSSYGIMAFDHQGEPQWTAPVPMPKTHHGSGASPVLAGDLVILNHDAMQGGYLLALNRDSGTQAWKQPYPASGRVESYSTPIVWHDQLILHRAGVIESYRITNGARLWSLPENTSGASTPVASDDVIYVSTWNNLGEEDQRPALPDFPALLKLYDKNGDGAIDGLEFPEKILFTARPGLETIPNSQNYVFFRTVDRNRDGKIDQAEWEAFRNRVSAMATDHGLLAIRVKEDKPEIIWRENTSIPEVPSPLLYKGRLFMVRNGGVATCLDAGTGKVIFRARIGAPGAYFASPIAAAGRVYFASSEGVVTIISADSEQLKVLARNELGEDMVATPAISGNAIYIRTLRNIYDFLN